MSKDLQPVYGCVQGGHAVAQWLLENKDQTWNNEYLVYLYADLEKELFKLKLNNVNFSAFYEPDLDGKLTSIAVLNDGSLFKNLKLVG